MGIGSTAKIDIAKARFISREVARGVDPLEAQADFEGLWDFIRETTDVRLENLR